MAVLKGLRVRKVENHWSQWRKWVAGGGPEDRSKQLHILISTVTQLPHHALSQAFTSHTVSKNTYS